MLDNLLAVRVQGFVRFYTSLIVPIDNCTFAEANIDLPFREKTCKAFVKADLLECSFELLFGRHCIRSKLEPIRQIRKRQADERLLSTPALRLFPTPGWAHGCG